MINAQLCKAIRDMLDLLLLRHDLLIHKVYLLRGQAIVVDLGWFPRCRSLTSDIIQGVLIIGLKLGMFELPGLRGCQSAIQNRSRQALEGLTFGPYGD